MNPEIVNYKRPPNYHLIVHHFPAAKNRGVVFAYGEQIYVPSGITLPPEIIEHEKVHCVRQLQIGVNTWWSNYITDHDFRYNEELIAHVAEYKRLIEFNQARPYKRKKLRETAKRLTSPLYGFKVTRKQAEADIFNMAGETNET